MRCWRSGTGWGEGWNESVSQGLKPPIFRRRSARAKALAYLRNKDN
jgi:hypothetical protein